MLKIKITSSYCHRETRKIIYIKNTNIFSEILAFFSTKKYINYNTILAYNSNFFKENIKLLSIELNCPFIERNIFK